MREDTRAGLRASAAGAAILCLLGLQATVAMAADKYTLGYSVGFLADPFQVIQVNRTVDEAKKAGLKTLPVANANGDPGKQITDVHNLIASGAQGIIVVARDSDAIVPALDFAASKSVPVVSIDMGPNGGKAAMVVRADNLRMGEDACKQMGQGARRQGYRALADGRPGDAQRPATAPAGSTPA